MALVYGDLPLEDEPFMAAIAHMGHVVSAKGYLRLVVYAAGTGGPNAKQRTAFRQLARLPLRAVLISDFAAMRALVTVAGWIMQQPMRATTTRETASALDFLELSATERSVMIELLSTLCAEGGYRPLVL